MSVKRLAVFARERGLDDFCDVMLTLDQMDQKGDLMPGDPIFDLLEDVNEELTRSMSLYRTRMLKPEYVQTYPETALA